jgi:anti-sigma factor ChrR (cupin superfamily)
MVVLWPVETRTVRNPMMEIRSDLSKRALVLPGDEAYRPSPLVGVERRMLERQGDEVARATSVVRYAKGSRFTEHLHELGEEFLVLEGCFEDEHGKYATGAYVRNPPGSRHSPFSETGCTLFVKLRQFDPEDLERVVVDTRATPWRQGLVPGLTVMPLHAFKTEGVALVQWAPGTVFKPHTHFGGEEILVLKGVFEDEYGVYPEGSWLRSPTMSKHHPFSKQGAIIWVKTGHLG